MPGLNCPGWHVPRGVYMHDGIDPYAGNTTFCVTRHPYSKAISEYLYQEQVRLGCLKDGAACSERQEARAICNASSLNQWMLSTLAWVRPGVEAIPASGELHQIEEAKRKTLVGCHWLPQWMYVKTPVRGQLCDRVVPFENLDAKWAELVGEYAPELAAAPLSDFTTNKALCHMSVSDLEEPARALLRDLYARDFAMLNYSAAVLKTGTAASSSREGEGHGVMDTMDERARRGRHPHGHRLGSLGPVNTELRRIIRRSGEIAEDDIVQ